MPVGCVSHSVVDYKSRRTWGCRSIWLGTYYRLWSISKARHSGNAYLGIAGLLDQWEWWPRSFDGLSLADVGCFTGGLTLLMAARNPKVIYAIDEIPEHIHQCEFLCEVFKCLNVKTIQASLYNLQEHIEASSLDLVLLSGVLYHLSDMLVGLLIIRNLLKPGGILLIESNAVDDDKQSMPISVDSTWECGGNLQRCVSKICANSRDLSALKFGSI
ncbi:MAG: methyltransferase domain-containing protein [Actinomycetota bacterium]|nr:methyltransferase domain-containing protein [Actinomycetota bacterium]